MLAAGFIFPSFALTSSSVSRTESLESPALVCILDPESLRPRRDLGERRGPECRGPLGAQDWKYQPTLAKH